MFGPYEVLAACVSLLLRACACDARLQKPLQAPQRLLFDAENVDERSAIRPIT
jgi:hypothetical protein